MSSYKDDERWFQICALKGQISAMRKERDASICVPCESSVCDIMSKNYRYQQDIVALDDRVKELEAGNQRFKEALERLIDVYIERKDGKPYSIRVINIGMGLFDKAYDAFEKAREVLGQKDNKHDDQAEELDMYAAAVIWEVIIHEF